MLLLDIKNLLQERGQMTRTEIARHFYLSESAVESMMQHWIRKGVVETRDLSASCGSGCGSCNEAVELKQVYRFKAVAQKPIAVQSSNIQ